MYDENDIFTVKMFGPGKMNDNDDCHNVWITRGVDNRPCEIDIYIYI